MRKNVAVIALDAYAGAFYARQVQEGEGAGVGLYLARRILEAQGGTICVKRGRRGGSDFIVTLPYNSVMHSVSVL